MDNRRLLLVMLIALPLILLWDPMVVFIGRQLGYDMTRKPPTTQVAADPAQPTTQPLANVESTTQPSAAVANTGGIRAVGANSSESIDIGSVEPNHGTYAMGLKLSSRGAGIEGVTLNRYQEAVHNEKRYVFQQPYARFVDFSRPMGSREITLIIDGARTTIDLSKVDWTLQNSTADSATYSVNLSAAGGDVVRATKTFRIDARDKAQDKGGGYEIFVDLKFENLSGKPLSIVQNFTGPILPPKELDRGSDRNIIGGYVEGGQIVRIRHDLAETFAEKKPTLDYSKGTNAEPLLWAGACSVYFNAILRPDPLAGATDISPSYIAKVEAKALSPAAEDVVNRDIITQFETTELNLAAGQSVTLPMRFFVGPRLRSLLNNDYLGSLPLQYNDTLVLTGGPCAWCTFQWLVNILVWLLGVIHFVVRDWGIAIIVLVLIVRTLLHPITKKAQVNMMGMAKFGPELERLKKKYGDNKEELNRAMIQFYKEHGATPILGCLPMLLQMPIWIALFSALQSTFELRQAPFLEIGGVNLTWIKDLSQPDHLIKLEKPIHFFFMTISGLNILPFLLAAVFWIQHKVTPKPPAMSPEQEQQQKMMQWMTLLFPVFLYGGPSGLNLYILASTTFGIIESKIIRNHIKRKEELEKAGAVVVDAEDTPRGKRKRDDDSGPAARGGDEPKKPQGWLGRKMAEMQKRVEELQKQAEKNQRKKPR